MSSFNKVQEAAFELVREDLRFLLTLVDIFQNAKNVDSNYISMETLKLDFNIQVVDIFLLKKSLQMSANLIFVI
ncbi:MAG: hypothetical protein WCD89_20700 [Anaerocolumna sp.]